MQRVKVVSSNVAEVGYQDGILEVLYANGGLYHYFDVPESAFTGLLAAASIGSYLHRIIKPRYRCERVEQPASAE